MQVTCPHCGERGLLQKITPRYYRVRHTIKLPYYSNYAGRMCYNRDFSYCRVSTEWAMEQYEAKRSMDEAELRRLLGH